MSDFRRQLRRELVKEFKTRKFWGMTLVYGTSLALFFFVFPSIFNEKLAAGAAFNKTADSEVSDKAAYEKIKRMYELRNDYFGGIIGSYIIAVALILTIMYKFYKLIERTRRYVRQGMQVHWSPVFQIIDPDDDDEPQESGTRPIQMIFRPLDAERRFVENPLGRSEEFCSDVISGTRRAVSSPDIYNNS